MNLDKSICISCGEEISENMGIWERMNHSDNCSENKYTYRIMGGMSLLREMKKLIQNMNGETDDTVKLEDCLIFAHFSPIKFVKHPLDVMLYSYAREFEIKQMKRIRNLIKLEENFNYKY